MKIIADSADISLNFLEVNIMFKAIEGGIIKRIIYERGLPFMIVEGKSRSTKKLTADLIIVKITIISQLHDCS